MCNIRFCNKVIHNFYSVLWSTAFRPHRSVHRWLSWVHGHERSIFTSGLHILLPLPSKQTGPGNVYLDGLFCRFVLNTLSICQHIFSSKPLKSLQTHPSPPHSSSSHAPCTCWNPLYQKFQTTHQQSFHGRRPHTQVFMFSHSCGSMWERQKQAFLQQ